VSLLWGWMLDHGMKIFFAHRTFQWNSEARGKAAVHCVIIGFAAFDISPKRLFEYEDIKSDPQQITAKNINPYLVDAPDVLIEKRSKPICDVAVMMNGSKPTDGGNLLLNDKEKMEFLQIEPGAAEWIHPFIGADEFINNIPRWCLWLKDCPPEVLRKMPEVLKRVEGVRQARLGSKKVPTRKWANQPALFIEDRQPIHPYLAIPEVSSERRNYIPIAFLSKDVICSNKIQFVPGATLFHFGILQSSMHNAWMRAVCGRLESRYSYSATIVYNNFPWPENPGDNQKQAIETAAQAVLDARAQFPDASLADLYDPLTMPPVLLKAHQKLDKAVDAAYGKRTFPTEAARVAFLFELYQKYISLLKIRLYPSSVKP
jgi:hypothetical protein